MRQRFRPSRSWRAWPWPRAFRQGLACLVPLLAASPLVSPARAGDRPNAGGLSAFAARYDEEIQPIVAEFCGTCHADGMKKGGVDFDALAANESGLHDRKVWWSVLKNVRAGIMPPKDEPQLSAEDRGKLERWIKYDAFGIDARDLNPGRVTVRRLNRTEYRNTIRDLMGIEFNTSDEFPPDDSGHGFDNIGDVLTISPLLLEKYVAAAKTIVSKTVPASSRVVAETVIPGRRFQKPEDANDEKEKDGKNESGRRNDSGSISLSYYEPATVVCSPAIEHGGRYQLVLDLTAAERYVDGVFDYNRCKLIFKVDGKELFQHEYTRQEGRTHRKEFDVDWEPGAHAMSLEVQPLTNSERVRSLSLRINSVTLRGPYDERHYVRPADYAKFFPREVPETEEGRRGYARELLDKFALKAFRRPAEAETLDRLVNVAMSAAAEPGGTFEAGVSRAMMVVLASPRFLFREENPEPDDSGRFPAIDEYALATRLSYFLWSTMPDETLLNLAGEHKLRANLSAQVERMLADRRSDEFFRNFVGQWLQTRDMDSIPINAAAVIGRDEPRDPEADRKRARFRELFRKPPDSLTDAEKEELKEARATFARNGRRFREFELTRDLRQAMRRETEMVFESIIRDDRPLDELLDSDSTFLNERLARFYGIDGVTGENMRKVSLASESHRGGLLTQGTTLIVTSNPDRTSPVKRGLFVLENILGTPPPPPPPDIPPLEDAVKTKDGRTPTLRESLAIHRASVACAGCHNRMDPLGLALENFNALGRWRDKEAGQPVDAAGQLVTGEVFNGIGELKTILVDRHRREFYRCLSEKLLTYALGRGLDAADVEAVDRLVERIESGQGKSSTLLMGIIESVPFQKSRRPADEKPTTAQTSNTPDQGEDS